MTSKEHFIWQSQPFIVCTTLKPFEQRHYEVWILNHKYWPCPVTNQKPTNLGTIYKKYKLNQLELKCQVTGYEGGDACEQWHTFCHPSNSRQLASPSVNIKRLIPAPPQSQRTTPQNAGSTELFIFLTFLIIIKKFSKESFNKTNCTLF